MPPTSRQAPQGRDANTLLLESLFPGVHTGAHRGSDYGGGSAGRVGEYLDLQGNVTSSLAGLPGVNATTRPTGGDTFSGGGGGTLLPSLANIPTDTTTLFEAYQGGGTTDFENQILGNIGDTLGGSGGGGSLMQSGGGTLNYNVQGAINDIGSVSVDDIGTITTEIVGNLPSEFQSFITRLFDDTSQQAMEAELDNLSSALQQEAELSADTLGGKLMSRFSAMGMGTSGSAMEAFKEMGVEIATRVNSQIAQARLGALQNLLAERQTAVNQMNVLLQAGEAQRAQDIQGQIAEMDAKARLHASAMSAQAQVQNQLLATSAQLELGRMDLLSNTLGELTRARQIDEQTRVQQQTTQTQFPYQVLSGIAGNSPVQGKGGGGFDAGGAIGGIGALAGGIGAFF